MAGLTAVPADGAALSSAPLSAAPSSRGTPLGFQEGTMVGFSFPSSAAISVRSGLTHYKAKRGDTPAKIAARFDITLETLERANPKMKVPLKTGTDLLILPVSGMLYEIAPGDSMESVTARYKISPETFVYYNPGYERLFTAGKGTLILPYAAEIK
ncbi:MAG: LysM domain-containing protein [Candidatus Jorgensenbacteria bacterium]